MQISGIDSSMLTNADIARQQVRAQRFTQDMNRMQNSAEVSAAGTLDGAAAKQAAEDKKLREACQDFEAMFMSIMYKQMRNTVPENELFGKSNGEKIFESMLDDEVMKNASKAGGVGLGDMLYRQLKLETKSQQDTQNAFIRMKNQQEK